MWSSAENVFSQTPSFRREGQDEEELRWAALERLPTCTRVKKGILKNASGEDKEIEISEIERHEQKIVLDRLLNSVEEDPELLFSQIRKRFAAVNMSFPKIEVRYQNLKVEKFVHIGKRALPTIPNFIFDMAEALLRCLRIYRGNRSRLTILSDVSGIIRPSRMTLLLGPPSSGKTTLLLALAGRLGHVFEMSGKITYNGFNLEEFVAPKTSAYVSQQDCHVAEMTIRETLDLAACSQGVGCRYDMLLELSRREKCFGVTPDKDLDIFLKSLVLGGKEAYLVVEHIMKFLGLDTCAGSLVGDEMLRGVSGGQKKRLSTGELLVGPARVLFMDEISNGLDSSTTYQIIKYIRHSTCLLDGSTLISLLQPAPETYELFDDIILVCEGHIIYQGPRESVLEFFSSMGFMCPKRKNIADFLQEVTSRKDQEQFWSVPYCPHRYISPRKFADAFRSHNIGKSLSEELGVPFDKSRNHPAALSKSQYGLKQLELFMISFKWQMLLMKRNSFIYFFKFFQLLLVALITMSVFFRGTLHHTTLYDGTLHLGALYFSVVIIIFNGFTEVSMLVAKLPVLYKYRDLHFFPCWVYTLPSWLLSIPISIIESGLWVAVTYYVIGYDSDITRFFKQMLLFFFLHQMSTSLFRVIGAWGRNMIVANTFGSFATLLIMVFGGFIISRDKLPPWWIWGYWFSPMMYAQNAASLNEFLAHSWDKRHLNGTDVALGKEVLKDHSLFTKSYWYWIGIGALLGYTVLFNILFTFFLAYLNPLVGQCTVVAKEQLRGNKGSSRKITFDLRHYLQNSGHLQGSYFKQKGMVLPFQPHSMSFSNINYFVDIPMEFKQEGSKEEKLQLLFNITGAFRPGVLTALVGVSGAGKTTLMDVLAGRKTAGTVDGSVYISGYPKNQDTFARISGYCEQNDVHSPCLTVLESLLFSAWLRSPSGVDMEVQRAFVEEVLELVELTPLRGALVGLPGVDGLSLEQRKRLTIAVELVSNPSIVFMDEPTSGLDARSAAIIMRAIRNIVNTGRTIVCTIHQPSIEIFESFDEIMLLKRGGKLIYAGPLGPESRELIKYFEAIEGVPKIKHGQNPATWMLDVTSQAEEDRLGFDFAKIYNESFLFRCNRELVDNLSKPSHCEEELQFPSKYSRSFFEQFLACLWKQNLSYWKNPQYTAVRFFFTVVISLILGTVCWRFGATMDKDQELLNAMGSMYLAVLFIGITNATAAQPVVSVERFVSYRERAARMYSALAFAFAQVVIELPYVLVQTVIYCAIFYSMASFKWTFLKFAWYTFFMYFTLLYFTYYGMMTTAITPNHNVAAIVAAPFYMLWNLFSGFMIPYKRIPIWWRWYYWANPMAWTLYGLLTSQYGDDDKLMTLSDGGHRLPIWKILHDMLGYRYDFLPVSGIMVVSFSLLFAFIFAFAIKIFNFQKR